MRSSNCARRPAQSPEPVRRWLIAMVGGGSSAGGASPAAAAAGGRERRGAARAGGGGGAIPKQLNAAAKKATVRRSMRRTDRRGLCQKAVAGRYPFVPGSANDIPLDDFARLFAPGGLLDTFFNTQLRPFVNTAGANWKLQPAGDVDAADLAGRSGAVSARGGDPRFVLRPGRQGSGGSVRYHAVVSR